MGGVNLLTVVIVIFGIITWLYINKTIPRYNITTNLNLTYDYIIVGAGSAGAVLASRLSEDPSLTVLLLEAGGSDENNELINTPLAAFSLVGSDIDWGFATVPQKEAMKSHKDNRNLWPRGRVLGGTSSLNHLAYARGSRHDYDQWAAEGCDGWAYRDVLPYFIKSEDVRAKWLQNSPYHGKGGPLAVSPGQVTDLNKYYGKAMQEIGYDTVDCNGESQIGYEPITLTVKDGSRCITANSFLAMAAHRPNLHISTNSHVTKVLIKDTTAFGVSLLRDNRKHSVRARREVILSAGSVNSPQILMLSGIGPKEHLKSLKIPVVADLPVGQNLQDHIFVPVVFFPNVSLTISPDKMSTLWNLILYKITGKGYFSTSGLEGTSFINTDDKSSGAHANIQIAFCSVFFPGSDKDFATSKLNFKEEIADLVLKMAYKNGNGFTLLPTLLRPKSKGTITLQSNDPFDPPIIDPQYLTDREDMETLLKGVKKTLELGNTSTFRALGIELKDTYILFPQCTKYQIPSDEYLECYIRHYAFTVYHPTTTCRMGRKDDPTAVVSSHLKVKGISNLRVADASVMRNVVSGNTNAPTIMIAEKAADMIRGVDTVNHIRQKVSKL